MDCWNIKCGFHVSAVKKSEDLYDWNDPERGLLNKVLSYVCTGTSFLIYGERRSGKTSILNCINYELQRHSGVPIPAVVDFQSYGFRKMIIEDGYRYILTCISKSMNTARSNGETWISSPLIFQQLRKDFLTCSDITSFPQECSAILLLDEIESFFIKNKKSLVLMFDEYERLQDVFYDIKDTFFYPFRKLQDRYDPNYGGIFCIIAGAEEPSSFLQRYGSPQFNLFTDIVRVPPISRTAFTSMWKDLREQSSPECQQNLDSHGSDIAYIYDLCGGRPGFAKLLGRHWALPRRESCNPLESWFRDIFLRQPDSAREFLISLAQDHAVDEDSEDARRLLSLYLIEKNPDPEMRGLQISGILWKKFLQAYTNRQQNIIPETPSIENAGDLAKYIIQYDKLEALLRIQNGKGEKADWLEFKAALIPSDEQKRRDQEKNGHSYSNDDYVWHTLKAILAMRNSRGGLICIGVKDCGEIIGIQQNNSYNSSDDFIRNNIVNKINKYSLSLHGGKKIEISNFNISNLLSSGEITLEQKNINSKIVIFIAVKPIMKKTMENIISITEKSTSEREYIIVRSRHTNNREIVKFEERRKFIDTLWNNDDLYAFWNQLL